MKIASVILPLVLLVASPCHADDVLRVISGTVQKVSDGDTIQLTDGLGTKVKIRLYGIDAPETEKRSRRTGMVTKPGQPYGEEAMQALTAKVKGKQVQVEVRGVDRYKRAVSVVRIGSRDINEEIGEGGVGLGVPAVSGKAVCISVHRGGGGSKEGKAGALEGREPGVAVGV